MPIVAYENAILIVSMGKIDGVDTPISSITLSDFSLVKNNQLPHIKNEQVIYGLLILFICFYSIVRINSHCPDIVYFPKDAGTKTLLPFLSGKVPSLYLITGFPSRTTIELKLLLSATISHDVSTEYRYVLKYSQLAS